MPAQSVCLSHCQNNASESTGEMSFRGSCCALAMFFTDMLDYDPPCYTENTHTHIAYACETRFIHTCMSVSV